MRPQAHEQLHIPGGRDNERPEPDLERPPSDDEQRIDEGVEEEARREAGLSNAVEQHINEEVQEEEQGDAHPGTSIPAVKP
jgi:hypothetical protein